MTSEYSLIHDFYNLKKELIAFDRDLEVVYDALQRLDPSPKADESQLLDCNNYDKIYFTINTVYSGFQKFAEDLLLKHMDLEVQVRGYSKIKGLQEDGMRVLNVSDRRITAVDRLFKKVTQFRNDFMRRSIWEKDLTAELNVRLEAIPEGEQKSQAIFLFIYDLEQNLEQDIQYMDQIINVLHSHFIELSDDPTFMGSIKEMKSIVEGCLNCSGEFQKPISIILGLMVKSYKQLGFTRFNMLCDQRVKSENEIEVLMRDAVEMNKHFKIKK